LVFTSYFINKFRNIIAVVAKCHVSENWKVIRATGAVGAFLGAKLYDCVDKK